jgi:hypothetical protein
MVNIDNTEPTQILRTAVSLTTKLRVETCVHPAPVLATTDTSHSVETVNNLVDGSKS